MAVKALASVVIQKLTDMLAEESIINEIVIFCELKEIKKDLEEMGGYLVDAQDKQTIDEQEEWAEKCLQHLYQVEDTIETFALRFVRPRKTTTIGFAHALFIQFLKNFTACGNPTGKIKGIRHQINQLNRNRPRGRQDASVTSTTSLLSNGTTFADQQIQDAEEQKQEQQQEVVVDHDHDEDVPTEALQYSNAKLQHIPATNLEVQHDLAAAVTSVTDRSHHIHTEMERLSKDHQFSNGGLRALSDASVLAEHLNQSRPVHSRSHDDEEERDIIEVKQDVNITTTDHNHHVHSKKHQFSNGGFRVMSNASVLADRLNHPKLMYSYSYNEEELDIVGFKKDVLDLVKTLAGNNTSRVVSIVGERGSGKTTLARAVYGSRTVKERFKSEEAKECCSAWVTVSKESPNAIVDLLLKLLKQVGSSKDQGSNLIPYEQDALKTRLRERLKEKRYLIVLEDFERSNMWDDLQDAFPEQQPQNGSKILLITCHRTVANYAKSHMHKLKKLNNEDSWELFLKKAGWVVGPDDLREKVLQVCNGLPLNIVLLGSLLSTKKEEDEWQEIIQSSQASPKLGENYDLIPLSYNDLRANLKLCLIYMVLFPKEFDIPVRRLQSLWLAEGFVKRSKKPSDIFQEDVVKRYFDILVKRSLIQVSKLTSDGRPKRCRLLGVLHDHLSPEARVISLFHVHHKYSGPDCQEAGPFGVRRLVEYTDIKNCSLYPSQLGSLRSYLSFNIQKKDTPATEVGKLLSNILSNGLRLLRVLDLEGVYKPSLPNNLGDFFHLRYLGLRWTFLDSLPESVGHLHYLETLDIKHTHINTLPSFIWKMKHLKHLYANGIHLDLPRHLCSSFPQLLSLWGFSVDDRSLGTDCLNRLVHLRELGITFQLSNSEQLFDWILKLTSIQTLRLRSKNDMGRPSMLSLKPLSSLKELTHLNLLGNLPKLPGENDFPPELKVLTLSVSQLRDDPMPILGKLPKLTVLRLLANSYLGNKMACQRGGFKELRVLKLWMLKDLECWEVEEGAMERLKELNIRCCVKLKAIPSQLLLQKNFKEVILNNMPEAFRIQTKRFPHVSLTTKNYDFSPLPWEGAGDS